MAYGRHMADIWHMAYGIYMQGVGVDKRRIDACVLLQ